MAESQGNKVKALPVIGFAGFSGSGKTTLAIEVVRKLEQAGLRVAVVKHDGHGHYKEAEGTDSSAYRLAGASSVIVVSPDSLVSYERKQTPTLEELIARVSRAEEPYDLILAEGFKGSSHPKIAVARTEEDLTVLDRLGPGLVAIACSEGLAGAERGVQILSVNRPADVVRFILGYFEILSDRMPE